MASPSIFISYRREDTSGHAGRLYDRLSAQFGEKNVVLDVGTIAAGEDFAAVIRGRIEAADVLLALIGPRWLTATDAEGRWRLADENDLVRMEIATALRRKLRVVPTLLGNATMPRAKDLPRELSGLAALNAVEIRDSSFDEDVARLVSGFRPRWVHRLARRLPRRALAAAALAAVAVVGARHYLGRVTPEQARIRLGQAGVSYGEREFLDRVKRNDFEVVRLFLKAGMRPDVADAEATALAWAAIYKGERTFEQLLAAGADPNPALPKVIAFGHPEVVPRLLARGVDQTALDRGLAEAARRGDTAVSTLLVGAGAKVNARTDPTQQPALLQAAARGQTEQVRWLLANGADVRLADPAGNTALHTVAGADDARAGLEVAKLLIAAKADVNAVRRDGRPVLLHAIEMRQKGLAGLLIEHGADPNASGEGKGPPLLEALKKGYPDVAQRLLDKGADAKAVGPDGRTALFYAREEEGGLTTKLIARGLDVNTQDSVKRTPLMLTSPQTVEVLLAHGAKVNARDFEGESALTLAAQLAESDVSRLLLNAGADVNAANNEGWTALMNAIAYDRPGTAQLLLARGADASRRNEDGDTALNLAEKGDHRGLARLLRDWRHRPRASAAR